MLGVIVPIGALMRMANLIFGPITIRFGGASISNFPCKDIWKVKIPKRVAFLLWTTVHGRILTLDNLILRGRSLVNRCCMCYYNAESMDHIFVHCPVAHLLWVHMLQVLEIQWVMPDSVESLVFFLELLAGEI